MPIAGPPELRTVYIGQVDPETTYEELCNIVHGGNLENVKVGGGRRAALTLGRDHTYLTWPLAGGPRPGHTQIVAETQCAFVSFLSAEEANAYFNWATASPPLLRGRQVRIGWGKPSSLSPEVAAAASRGATRKVYIGGVRRGLRGLGRVWGLGRACGLGRAWGLGRACGFGRE